MAQDDGWFSEETATFGDRLAAAREAAGLSQSGLAGKLGVKRNVIAGWEDDLKEPRKRAKRTHHPTGAHGPDESTGRAQGQEAD